MGAPGCPLLACCTASIAKVRIVLMHSVSNCLPVTTACSLATMGCALLPGDDSAFTELTYWLALLEFPGHKGLQIRHRVYQFLARWCRGFVKIWRENAETQETE